MKALQLIPLVTSAAALACASTPRASPELDGARQAYVDAARGPAAQYAPNTLRSAKQSLDAAEVANRRGETDQIIVARLANTRAQLADARGRAALSAISAKRQHDAAVAAEARARLAQAQTAQGQRERMPEGREPGPGQTNMQPGGAASAMPDRPLYRMADRQAILVGGGTAIVITRDLEFRSGSARLTAPARVRLDRLSYALREEPTMPKLSIEGFTDSSGDDAANDAMSRDRATAVANYLAGRGIPADHIVTRGRGTQQPAGDNGTASGRASNRRVEIFVVPGGR